LGGSEERFDQRSLRGVITVREGMMKKAVEKGTGEPFEGRLRVPQKSSGAARAVRPCLAKTLQNPAQHESRSISIAKL
jgi:hypothetical protein